MNTILADVATCIIWGAGAFALAIALTFAATPPQQDDDDRDDDRDDEPVKPLGPLSGTGRDMPVNFSLGPDCKVRVDWVGPVHQTA